MTNKNSNAIPDDVIKKIKENSNIVDIVSEYVDLQKKGKNYFGLSPFTEEKTPSFTVNPETNKFYCYSTGTGGDSIDFLMKIKNYTFQEASKILGEKLGISVKTNEKVFTTEEERILSIFEEMSSFYSFALKHSASAQKALDYLNSRGISNEEIDEFKIGYSLEDPFVVAKALMESKGFKKNELLKTGAFKETKDGLYDIFNGRIIFPISNIKGQIVSFNGRAINKDVVEKYLNGPQTDFFKKSETIYRFDKVRQAVVSEGEVILHEGVFDVIASYKAGKKNVVASMGTSLSSNQAKIIKRLSDKVLLVFDGDDAGLKAMVRSVRLLQNEKLEVDVALLTGKLDPDDFIKKFGVEEYIKELDSKRIDGYNFCFNYYIRNKNLDNVNDLLRFKKELFQLLDNEDDLVKDYFRNKILKKFNIDIPYEEAKRAHFDSLTNKEISKILINEILRSNDNLDLFNNFEFETSESDNEENIKWLKWIIIERNKNKGQFNYNNFRLRMKKNPDPSYINSFDNMIENNIYYKFNLRYPREELILMINKIKKRG